MLLGVVARSFKLVKLLSQHFFCSVIAEAQRNNVGSGVTAHVTLTNNCDDQHLNLILSAVQIYMAYIY